MGTFVMHEFPLQAAKLAESMQETAIVKRLFCLIGVAQGNISLKSFMDEKRALIRT